jgi:cytochrome c553
VKRLFLALALWGCGAEDAPAPAPSQTAASLAFGADGRLWVTSPDDGAVVGLNAESLAVEQTVAVSGEPARILAVGERLVVVGARSAAVTFIGGAAPQTAEIPCGGATGLAARGDRLFVACPFDGRVVELSAKTQQVVRVLQAAGRPTAVAISRGRLWVSASARGVLRSALVADLPEPGSDRETPASVAWRLDPLPTRGVHAAVQLDALYVADDRLVGAYQLMQHDGDRDRAPEDGGYGRVTDGDPRIEPRALADCGGAYAVFDGGARALSGPSAVALDAARDRLWVVHRGTGDVTVFGCAPGAQPERLPIIAQFRVGDGARGIILDAEGVAWVDVAFDYAVARLDVNGPPTAQTRRPGDVALSEHARLGRRLFHDARNVHLTPSGVVTCATCHPDGGDDGLSWFLHTVNVPRKLRRTPPAWAIDTDRRPLHWDGEFTTAGALVSAALQELLEGDGLLVDREAVGAWMRERSPPIPRPQTAAQLEAAERGRRSFAAAECGRCHAGPTYTDGLPHDVLGPSADPDGALRGAVTPTLVAIRARAPYLHDGRAPTLEALVAAHGADVPVAERPDLITFLEGL